MHYASRDLTVGLSIEDVRGGDTATRLPPIMIEHNHSTGVLLDFSGGLLR